ncbi:MAG: hypothetical protein PWP63_1740 [Methanolobus sp.]|jgi:hypothetical protein|nr:hypothetical protein [Methanolobus sp.]
MRVYQRETRSLRFQPEVVHTDRLNSFAVIIRTIALFCFGFTKQLGTLKMIRLQVQDQRDHRLDAVI